MTTPKNYNVILEKESLEPTLLNINPEERKLDTPKCMPKKAKKTNKESEGKSITIDLEVNNYDNEGKKLMDEGKIESSSEEVDHSKDNLEDEDFQVKEDEPEVNHNDEMEEMDEEEEGEEKEEGEDESTNTESEPEALLKSLVHPNISEDEDMVLCSPISPVYDDSSNMEGIKKNIKKVAKQGVKELDEEGEMD
ncbi:uncharacterized protein LOC131857769 [Cryptomeria japonica]|uniref:uncharacterized protein LOC131857769 n=1 Tax=Cryptomeria japonica TaxID=3369 RepID=UPI0027D9D93A|nr:uncharacterized protein LOC131857769 [Cryptomeria japonica]